MFQRLKNSFVVLNFLFASCQQLPVELVKPYRSESVSSIDTSYRISRFTSEKIKSDDHQSKQYKSNQYASSASVSVYQKLLRPSLYSRCQYMPSDSAYAQTLARNCGTTVSLLKTFDRFLREPDAGYFKLPVVSHQHGISFVDLPSNCEL